MKFAAHHLVIALLVATVAVLSWALIYVSRDELRLHGEEYEEEIETLSTASIEDGRPVVRVDQQSQQASGIRLQALAAARFERALQVYGQVVDIEPLLELRGRYLAASGEQDALRAEVSAAEIEFRRAQTLYDDDRNISEQAMRQAEHRFRVAQSRLAAATASMSVVRDALTSAWGPVVAKWATQRKNPELASLLSRRSSLVHLVFPFALPQEAVRPKLRLAPVAARSQESEARLVSAAPRASTALPGNTYFYLARGGGLRAGTRVIAEVGSDGAVVTGAVIPNKAVVWHAGKAWVYRAHDSETFGRYEIATTSEIGDGWFQGDAFAAGDEVVVSGAQLLLSEELKFQIRNENED